MHLTLSVAGEVRHHLLAFSRECPGGWMVQPAEPKTNYLLLLASMLTLRDPLLQRKAGQ